ncbi:NAD-dependent epimerase/dehydratase family protein [Actinokineospora sp.]|uniref:NAD-dependent epimerase/dehydratase family protein n=1 Tax=Actinokineospora sp. TaxID=1872133 RepID=UPI0040382FD2
MRLLVLGGTAFVGRSVVTAAVDSGWSVATFNRGRGTWAHPLADQLTGDRLHPADLEVVLTGGRWDAVVDTWSGAPRVVRDSADALAGHADRYLYVSSRAVYAPPPPRDMDETCPTVDAAADAEAIGYQQDKRGAEIAVETAFGDRAVLARAGLILGPHEDVGRLPHWLLRIERGGEVLAPGPPDLPVRYIDARDLATWLLDAAENGVSGPVNLVNRADHTTMRTLLTAAITATGGNAELTWVDPAAIEAAGIDRRTELPGWIPPDPELAGLIWTNVDRAHATGLRCRPVADTVADTWAWLVAANRTPPSPPPGHPPLGLDPAKERKTLTAWHRSRTPTDT